MGFFLSRVDLKRLLILIGRSCETSAAILAAGHQIGAADVAPITIRAMASAAQAIFDG